MRFASVALFLMFLVISIPFCYSAQYSLTYDQNGNLVTGDGQYRVYNSMNKLIKIFNGSNASGILIEEDIHDTDGEKIILRKIYNSTGSVIERQYYPSDNSVFVRNLTAQTNITRVYHNGQLIAEKTNSITLFTITDHKGDIVAVANSTGSVIENTSYGPYGDITSGGTKTRVGYEAKTYSSVLKSYDFNSRRYSPPLFEQPDTVIQNVYDPQGLNRYMFERGNPQKNRDDSGHVSSLIINIGEVLGGFVLGATSEFSIPALIIYSGAVAVGVLVINAVNNANAVQEINIDNVKDYDKIQAGVTKNGYYDEWRDAKELFDNVKDGVYRENGNDYEMYQKHEDETGWHINKRVYDKNEVDNYNEWKNNGKDPSSKPPTPQDKLKGKSEHYDPLDSSGGKDTKESYFDKLLSAAKKWYEDHHGK